MKWIYALTLLTVFIAPNVGCAGNRYAASRWSWRRPGYIENQRISASVHDPYPDKDLAPEVVGGRPRDFMNQYPEAVRNRFYFDANAPR